MPEEKMLNGLNVSAVENLINDVKENPELAKSRFRANKDKDGRWAQSYYRNRLL